MNEKMEKDPFEIIMNHTQGAPTNLSGIAYDLKVELRYTRMHKKISSKLMLHGKRGGIGSFWAIYVNEIMPAHKQRFSLAHSLAHYILHRELADEIIDNERLRSAQLSKKYEIQANRLACNMILPIPLVKRLYIRNKNIEILSNTFKVTPEAMMIRIGEFDKEMEAERLGKTPKIIRNGFGNNKNVSIDVI
jgi:IrrE N-terminal-like domain